MWQSTCLATQGPEFNPVTLQFKKKKEEEISWVLIMQYPGLSQLWGHEAEKQCSW
jgi:hypothetical protein